jgi:hypothetical protein
MARSPKIDAGIVERIDIAGFKSIARVTLDLGLFNVFVGANGSGKSSLFEAIAILGAAAHERIDADEILRRGARVSPAGRYDTHLAGAKTAPRMALSARGRGGGEYAAVLRPPNDGRERLWRYQRETLSHAGKPSLKRLARGGFVFDENGEQRRVPAPEPTRGFATPPGGKAFFAERALLGRLGEFTIFEPRTSVLRSTEADRDGYGPLGVRGGHVAEALAALLAKQAGTPWLPEAFDLIEWADGVDIVEPSPELLARGVPSLRYLIRFHDRFMPASDGYVSAYDASEGALYVLFAMVLAHHPEVPQFAAIEHIDNALHPRLARRLFQILRARVKVSRQQLLLSTHDPSSLDGLDLRDPDVRLFAVYREGNGATAVRRVEPSEAIQKALASEIPRRLTLSQLWIEGLLGGGPERI